MESNKTLANEVFDLLLRFKGRTPTKYFAKYRNKEGAQIHVGDKLRVHLMWRPFWDDIRDEPTLPEIINRQKALCELFPTCRGTKSAEGIVMPNNSVPCGFVIRFEKPVYCDISPYETRLLSAIPLSWLGDTEWAGWTEIINS